MADENKNEDVDLLIDTHQNNVRILTLNRPKKRNALATSLLENIAKALEEADGDDKINAIIITGGSKIFAAGADIHEMAPKGAPEGLSDPRPALWGKIRSIRKPIIAAVEGWCLGAGNELLLCCDIAIASAEAKFGQPETNLGIIPGAGGSATLMRIIGRGRAMKMVLTGEPISAHEALSYGLVAQVEEVGTVFEAAKEVAEKISSRAPLAMQQAKAVIKAGFETPHSAHLTYERQAFSLLFGTSDKKEGVDAFLEKRKPIWSGS